jgi:hypothetical protein
MFKRVEKIRFNEFMEKKRDSSTDFFTQNLMKEVEQIPDNVGNPRKIIRFVTATSMTFTSLLATTAPVGAEGSGLSPDIDLLFVKIQVACVGISASLAVLCLMAAGICRMLKLEKFYKDWTMEIYKGLVQIITAPVAVAILVAIIQMVMRMLPGHLPS